MKATSLRVALCLAVVTSPAFADGSTANLTSLVRDVRLAKGGLITGKALNTSARPIVNAEVVIQYGPHVVARTRTGADGSFAIRGLRAGAHTVSVGTRAHQCRFWTGDAAPPNALKTLAVNGDNGVVRGQWAPPVGLQTVGAAITFGVLGGVIGYNVRDTSRKKVTSP